ncbi:Uncharacterised protein [Chryseobacterium gleum]|uniref:Por secretion system C-terminal sorting domain n=2 Tax=Chryseobacterium gleum TaxID=250 RepID=A0A3S4QWW3_CHRGE|nr:hypothetical protein [Chryseobacterium gleum]EFK36466.1 hypothetical protein HMPREF0204_11913 [Chryseobacterium gleum ATCC 35910]QQY33694.1 hypothetical protein I6I60_08000 [Chryseobacterium gleum]VEE08215.1 Uncharacterised protein [Chryseobacterium gleum]
MKKSIFTVSACIGLLAVATSFSSAEIVENNKNGAELSDTATKTQTYKIRYGLLSKSGTKILSGNYDVGSFLAENMATGEVYDTYYSGGFQSVPQYYDGLPAGTYTFSAMQGQGGWVGYGTVVATVSDAQVDSDGYITVYIPIIWEE